MSDVAGRAFDAVLFLSFGGPEAPDEVMPFLENVTRGRGVPPERLSEVAQHYLHFGGVSPINRLNREMIDALRGVLAERGRDLPVYFGNRNWHPLLEDTLEQMYVAGHRRVLVFTTSAWGGYSGSEQYHEDLARGLSALAERVPAAAADPMLLRKLPQYCTEPAFLDACADAVRRAVARCAGSQVPPRIVFTAHSVPIRADLRYGPVIDGKGLYSRQVGEAVAAVARRVGCAEVDQVWQSRSGPRQVPWLEPDICDHLESLAGQGIASVVVVPIGFVSDHLEVVWDLDIEAAQLCERLGVQLVRAETVGSDPRFVEMIGDLIERYADGGGDLGALGIIAEGAW
ncbi:MAG: ferrochelatase [Gordonia sp. (in: high G+C Gram-positive bacteria)]